MVKVINDKLLCRIKQGDEKSFRILFNFIYPKLINIALIYIPNKADAEDVVSNVFFKLWKNRKKIENIDNIESYLCVSVKNQSLSFIKKNKKIISASELSDSILEIPDYSIDSEENIFIEELYQHIDRVTDLLPTKCKEIFKLAKVEGIKYKQISEMLNISIKTIDSQVSIAVKRISNSIKTKNK